MADVKGGGRFGGGKYEREWWLGVKGGVVDVIKMNVGWRI